MWKYLKLAVLFGGLVTVSYSQKTKISIDQSIKKMPLSGSVVTQAGFSAPDQACINKPVVITNTSTSATSYFWTFCETSFSNPPTAVNLGNPNNLLNGPVFLDLVQDNLGNFYVLCANNYNAHIIRFSYGNSLLNTPVVDDLGNFGGLIPQNTEGIQIVNVSNNWMAIIDGGDPISGNLPCIAKLDFGGSLSSTPIATNWGNVGNLNYPHELYIFQQNNNWYGYTVNSRDNTITKFNFGADFSTTPVGTNLGNVGNLDVPLGMDAIDYFGNWYLYITNSTGSVTRLDFGNSLLNSPTGNNIGNPQSSLANPRDISFTIICGDIKAIVANWDNNSITQLDFGSDPTSSPTSNILGNLGNLSFPHSISKLFRVNNDIYSFITNVGNNTITRLEFLGCNLPSSSVKDPLPITYTEPGIYYINLMTDLGLPTQSSYCKQIEVVDCCKPVTGNFLGSNICPGQDGQLTVSITSSPINSPYMVTYTDEQNNQYQQPNVQSGVPFTVSNQPTVNTIYTLIDITDNNNCKTAFSNLTAQLMVYPVTNLTITPDTTICLNTNAQLFVYGGVNYSWYPSVFLDNPNIFNPIASPTVSTQFHVVGVDINNCLVKDSVNVKIKPAPTFNSPPDQSVCQGLSVVIPGNNSPDDIYEWTPATGLDSPSSPAPVASPDQTTIYHLLISDAVCKQYNADYDVQVVVNPAPDLVLTKSNDIDCSNLTAQLTASGANQYSWAPGENLSDPDIYNPVASLSKTTQFVVKGTGMNGCYAYDSITVEVSKTGEAAYSVPNAFTPNNDNLNDCFGLRKWGNINLQEFSIYNRWGQLVFHSTNSSACWDGTLNGEPQPAGGYVYVIKASTLCGIISRKGTVLLIR